MYNEVFQGCVAESQQKHNLNWGGVWSLQRERGDEKTFIVPFFSPASASFCSLGAPSVDAGAGAESSAEASADTASSACCADIPGTVVFEAGVSGTGVGTFVSRT